MADPARQFAYLILGTSRYQLVSVSVSHQLSLRLQTTGWRHAITVGFMAFYPAAVGSLEARLLRLFDSDWARTVKSCSVKYVVSGFRGWATSQLQGQRGYVGVPQSNFG